MTDDQILDLIYQIVTALGNNDFDAIRAQLASPLPIAGEYTIHLSPEHDQMLQGLHANKRLAFEPEGSESLDLLGAFSDLIEWAVEVEWDAWLTEQKQPPTITHMSTVMSA